MERKKRVLSNGIHLWFIAQLKVNVSIKIMLCIKNWRVISSKKEQMEFMNGIAKSFEKFARLECEGASELYKTLALRIAELLQKVDWIGNKKDTFHIYNNIQDQKLHLDSYINGIKQPFIIGDTDGHGRWFDWYL